MFFKYHYAISYRVRPNKKTEGSKCALPIALNRKLENVDEQRKVLFVLSKIHRVNPDAIILDSYELEGRSLKALNWLKEKIGMKAAVI